VILCSREINLPDGWWFVSAEPVPDDSGREDDLAWLDQDPRTAADREAWLDHLCQSGDPPEEDDDEQYFEPLTPEELEEVRAAAADESLAAEAAMTGRRGPGMAGSARVFPGEWTSPAASFGPGMALDVTPGCPGLAVAADAAAGDDGRFAGVSDAELLGVVCAWDRVEAHAAAQKLAAIAEVYRRRPEPGCASAGPGRMPVACDEFAATELAAALGESRGRAEELLGCAWELAARLPGTAAALRDGAISWSKAGIILRATQFLDEAEAAAAEGKVLGRAGRLTPGGLRAAIARAVMEVAPEKARTRREQAARDARVERWAEDSGNAALMGRELPPDEVLAADQRITAWAGELKKAGLEGGMDVLRARAYLDLLLGKDSRPRPEAAGGGPDGAAQEAGGGAEPGDPEARSPERGGPVGPGQPGQPGGPAAGRVPAGFAARVNLTVPLATATGLADRPGELAGLGPIDPWLARDLATAAAAHPGTTWCITVTDQHGHAVGHGCARPEPKSHRIRAGPGPPPGGGTGFAFTPAGRDGPPGGYGTWRLRTPGNGPDLIVALDPIATENCEHRWQARGHDPGARLRHLTQVRHATCTGPGCRRPAAQSDFEHNIPYQAGGRTCLCNGGPKCRRDHRLKQHPRWKADQLPDGTFRWTTPAGRAYATEPTRYPI
jgi:uncharacterized protein DUF222